MRINAQTALYAVIGDPVSHSLSPIMHNTAFARLEINAVYLAFRVRKESLGNGVAGLKALGVRGFNVTIPHKEEVIKHLDEVEPEAKKIGAVNTVKLTQGRLIGYNTDTYGISAALKEGEVSVGGEKVVILGAGGTARAACFSLAEAAEITIVNRTLPRAQALAADLKKFFPGLSITCLPLDRLREAVSRAKLIVNTTSVGMWPNINETPIPPELLDPNTTVLDVVYRPVETLLLKRAAERGLKTISGLSMFIHQGAKSFEIWTGRKFSFAEVKASLTRAIVEAERDGIIW